VTVHIEHLPERRIDVRQGVLSESDDFIGRLGRHVEHDERSLAYAVEHIVDELLPPKTVSWRRWSPILDQGDLGSCTGNALTGALACEPFCTIPTEAGQFNEAFAVSLYSHATAIDGIPGQYPPDDTGSSGLAVCKVAKSMGLIGSYHHALTVSGLLHALQLGPVIIGAPWYEGFDRPDEHTGAVEIGGAIRGGHEFLVRAYQHGPTEADSWLIADNSWGSSWGVKGQFRFSVATWRTLAANQADVTIPQK
jgi:hypothetical protein